VIESVDAEWNELCRPSSVLRDVGDGDDDDDDGNRVMCVVLKLMKRFL